MKPEDLEGPIMQNMTYTLFKNHIIDLDEEDPDPKRESNTVILYYKPNDGFTILIDNYYVVDSIVEIYENLDFKCFEIYFDMPVRCLEFKDESKLIDRLKVYQIKSWNLKMEETCLEN